MDENSQNFKSNHLKDNTNSSSVESLTTTEELLKSINDFIISSQNNKSEEIKTKQVIKDLTTDSLPKYSSPQINVQSVDRQLTASAFEDFSDLLKLSDNKLSFNKTSNDIICGYFLLKTPDQSSDDNDNEEEEEEEYNSSEGSNEKIGKFMSNEERTNFYKGTAVITETTRSEELTKFIEDIYKEKSENQKQKIVKDLSESETKRSKSLEAQDIEELINTVYSEYTLHQKKEIMKGLKEPKSERPKNKDIDNIEELIDKLYSKYFQSESKSQSKSQTIDSKSESNSQKGVVSTESEEDLEYESTEDQEEIRPTQ